MLKLNLSMLFLTVAVAATSTACAKKDNTSNGAVGSAALVQPTGASTGLKSQSSDGSFGLTDSGLSGEQIVVDLSTSPLLENSWAPSACLLPLPADFVIGQATCTTDATKSVAITAANTEQTCVTNANFGNPIQPTQPVPSIAGCSSVTISIKVFSPALVVTSSAK